MATQFFYFPNDQPLLPPLQGVSSQLNDVLTQIVTKHPPQESYEPENCYGGWTGPTSLAYLFLQVSSTSPDMLVKEQPAIYWAREYLKGERGHQEIQNGNCGVLSEKTSREAIRAAVTKDMADVKQFLLNIPTILAGEFPSELANGKAGVLYLLRAIRHYVPDSAPLLEEPIAQLTEKILAEGPDWLAMGARYLGAGHGDIGTITQVVLTNPSAAPRVEPWLLRLLDWQRENGNWDGKENTPDGRPLVQFCHGAPGFVISLLAMRPYFPALTDRIDAAVEKGRELIWKEGILKKEPNLCHGTLGNSMAFPPGERRNHFIAFSTPDKVAEVREKDNTLYEPCDYGIQGLNMSHLPGLAWVLLKLDDERGSIPMHSDI